MEREFGDAGLVEFAEAGFDHALELGAGGSSERQLEAENGKIAEHWDSVPKDKDMTKRDPNQTAKPK